MLPTTGDKNGAFVTESCLEQEEEYSTTAVAEKELNGASGNGNIDEPEHSICEKENIVETERTTTATIDTTMLPTTGDKNGAFVTESCLEQEEEYSTTAVAEEELNGASGNGNNEFETNMSEGNNNNNNNENNNNGNDNVSNDNIDNVENVEVEQTIENNEDTGKEANDNLNESSSSSNVDVSYNEQETNENNDDVVENGNEAEADSSNILDALHNQELIEVSDDDDTNSSSSAMYATLDDEWSNLSLPTNEKNDLSNDIDLDNSIPIDLSNDIAVNYASNLPHNPDAELINAKYIQQSLKDVPIFPEGSLGVQSPIAEDWLAKPAK